MVFIKGQTSLMKGKYHTEEARKKMSIIKSAMYKGTNNPFYGKKHSKQAREKIKEARKRQGSNVWNKGKRSGKEMPCSFCGKFKYKTLYKINHNKNGKFYCSPEHQRLDQVKENNPSWKKDGDISYVQMHRRVFADRGKADIYPCAMQDRTCKGMIEWASISHKANTDTRDYIPLCRSHHRRYDLRQK